MSNHAEIQKFRKDIEMLEKMQSLHFFDCMPVSCSRRVMRVPGGWIYDNINKQHSTNTVSDNINSVFVSDTDLNIKYSINQIKSTITELNER
ncbi:hypothetical protein FEF33_03505 [Moraxella osloensis]|jgi:hypothetical protein|nr:hypothetical protein FEF33_03505 [Moraxella osloensis]